MESLEDFKQSYFLIWQAAWNFHKQYCNLPGGSDEKWEKAIDAAEKLVNGHKDKLEYKFVKDLVLSVLAEMERADKRRRKGSKCNE